LYGIAHATVFATCGGAVLAALIRLQNLLLNGRLADQTRLSSEPPSCPAGMNPTATTTLQYPAPPAPVRPAALKMARVMLLKRRNLVTHRLS